MTRKMNTDGVVRVGNGRGFIVEHRVYFDFRDGNGYRKIGRNLVVTASHCLPHLPVMPGSLQETTYPNLLAPLGEEPSVWAKCLFIDPVSDLAIVGEPDNQVFGEESDAYVRLVDWRSPFAIAAPESGKGYMLALDGATWEPTALTVHVTIAGHGLSSGPTLGGQSGSPILDTKGRAVALVSMGSETTRNGVRTQMEQNGPQPILKLALPPWLLRATKEHSRKVAEPAAVRG